MKIAILCAALCVAVWATCPAQSNPPAPKASPAGSPGPSPSPTPLDRVVPARFFTDHMVLQADQPIRVWGDAPPGGSVRVQLGSNEASTKADAEGRWSLELPALPASSSPLTLAIRGENSETVFQDVLIGEVWFCAGQSNMEWGMSVAPQSRTEMATANIPGLRIFSVNKQTTKTPQRHAKSVEGWDSANPASLKMIGSHHSFSATAFYFGKALHERLGVPVGLIVAAWGGSPIEPWTPTGKGANYGGIYNGMVAPLTPLSLRGVTWYQGESNIKNRAGYADKLKSLIEQWRQAFSRPDLPFYFVEIAPCIYKNDPAWLGELRAAQAKVAKVVPNTGMVHTLDIPDRITNIHPNNKIDIGKRLARLALAKTYGIMLGKSISGPVANGFQVEGGGVLVSFEDNAGALKTTDGMPPSGFEVLVDADGGQAWTPATASIQGDRVLVADPGRKILGVRFCWLHDQQSNLRNAEDLPPSPFQHNMP